MRQTLNKKLNQLRRLFFLNAVLLVSVTSVVAAINVSIPQGNFDEDVMVTGPSVVEGNEQDVFETIQVINKYLRFAIGAVCMGVLIFGGIKLVTASGDAEDMKKVNNLMMGAGIGIAIAALSYTAIRVIINLL